MGLQRVPDGRYDAETRGTDVDLYAKYDPRPKPRRGLAGLNAPILVFIGGGRKRRLSVEQATRLADEIRSAVERARVADPDPGEE